ncbi:MAG: DUF3750 domain-containing protein [Hyphomicrobiales bacterium]|nr:DUF3750 domain-containing protein [Hyphomicrobiales bacterium]
MTDETVSKTRRWRWPRRLVLGFVLLYALPLGLSSGAKYIGKAYAVNWWEASHERTNQAPDPATTPEAVVQVYAARAFGWRGAFGVHTWIAMKPSGADRYTRLEVMGWGVRHGRPAIRINSRAPDAEWFGNRPERLVDLRGEGVDDLIEQIVDAAERYPFPNSYRVWPGPNSNTFTAHIGREVPALKLALPAMAIGKDYLPNGDIAAWTPSGTGFQVSLFGLFGLTLALKEGIEVNMLGLSAGVDVLRPALKLPGIGRLGVSNGA